MVLHGNPLRLARVLAVAACAATLFAPKLALADVATHTAAEIQTRYAQLRPVYSGSALSFAPSLVAPYTLGTVASGELQDGLNSINYVRFLAGLPDDITLDATLNSNAQHGAVLMAATGVFAHQQPQPANMDPAFYKTGNIATNSSNIGLGFTHLAPFNLSCMGDSDTGNIDRLGHRRWLLNPQMAKTGLGVATNHTVTWAFDRTRATTFAYSAVKWPAAGNFPAEMMTKTDAWSVQLNPTLYNYTTGTAGHTVTLRRVNDGKTWTFTSADTNKSGEYFNFDTSGYAISNCFVFRPNPADVGGYHNGDVFDVTISGGITTKAGAATSYSYRTTFVSQGGGTAGSVTTPTTGTRTVTITTSTTIAGPKTARYKRTMTVKGHVNPRTARGTILIRKSRLLHGVWVGMGSARVKVGANGVYHYSFKPSKRGQWHVTATYSGALGLTAYTKSKSATLKVTVK